MSTSRKLLSGIGWGGSSMVVVAGCQVVFLAVMARLLTPADFGLVAMGNICLRFLSYFAQLGVTPALIQKPELQADDIAAALSVSLGISFFCGLMALAAAPFAGHFFDMPALSLVISLLSLTFPLQGLAAVSAGLLRRNMEFRALGLIDAVAYVVGYGMVGVGLAWAGYGVWSLVAGAVLQTLLVTTMSYACARHSLRLSHSAAARRHFLGFGGRYSFIGFCEFIAGSFDALAIGKVMGSVSAGIYNRATSVANLPVQQPAAVIARAIFPLLSAAGTDHRLRTIGLQLSILAVGGYAFVAAATVSMAASPLVHTLLGDRWVAVIPVLQIFALSVAPRFVTMVVGVSLDALGALRAKLYVQFGCVFLMALAVVLTLPHGMVAVAAAVLVVELVRVTLLLWVVTRAMRGARPQWLPTLLPLGVLGLVTAGAVAGVLKLIPQSPPWLGLLAAMGAALLAVVLTALLCRRWLVQLDSVGWMILKVPRLGRLLPMTL